jgi:hypothetical protein
MDALSKKWIAGLDALTDSASALALELCDLAEAIDGDTSPATLEQTATDGDFIRAIVRARGMIATLERAINVAGAAVDVRRTRMVQELSDGSN